MLKIRDKILWRSFPLGKISDDLRDLHDGVSRFSKKKKIEIACLISKFYSFLFRFHGSKTVKQNWVGWKKLRNRGFMAFFFYTRSKNWKCQKINPFFPEKNFCIIEKVLIWQVFCVKTFRLHYIWLYWSLEIEKKTRRLNFVSFSGLENSET